MFQNEKILDFSIGIINFYNFVNSLLYVLLPYIHTISLLLYVTYTIPLQYYFKSNNLPTTPITSVFDLNNNFFFHRASNSHLVERPNLEIKPSRIKPNLSSY